MKKNSFLDKFQSKDTVYIAIIILLILIIVWINPRALLIGACFLVFTIIYSYLVRKIKRNEVEKYIANLTFDIDSVTKDTLLNFQMPLVIVQTDGEILWKNSNFKQLFPEENVSKELLDIIKEFKEIKNNTNEKTLYTQTKINERIYDIYANIVRLDKNKKTQEFALMMYFYDKTDYINLINIYEDSKLCFGVISIDNYAEVIQTISEERRAQVTPSIGKLLRNWISPSNGVVVNHDRDKYLIIFEKKYLQLFIDDKFNILEDAKKIDFGNKTPITLSGGIIVSDETLNEKYNSAFNLLDVALGRGGDQIVLKTDNKYDFFGGLTVEVEKTTKVKTRVVSQALKEFIETSKNVIIMGHRQSDVDCVGAGLGLYKLSTALGKQANILLDNSGDSLKKLLNKLEQDAKYKDVFINKNQAMSFITPETLLIVVDTHKKDFVEAPELLEETENIVIIDHHRRSTDMIENSILSFQEVYASSTCELVAEILKYSDLDIQLEPIEAESLYAGIMVDTKNFTLKSGVRTFEAAAYLRKQGADVLNVNQLFRKDIKTYILISDIIKNMEFVKENIAIAICEYTDNFNMIIAAQAADEMLFLDNVQASFVLCENEGKIYISGRSLGNVNVQVILEKLGGGGHINMAGTQMLDITLEEAKEKLKQAILEDNSNVE